MDLSKHLEKAEDAAKRRNYALAVKIYGQLLALQPDFGAARAGLHRVRFKKAEKKPPSKLFAYLGGGIHLLTAKLCGALKKHAAAARSYERFLAHDPLSEAHNLALGRALESSGCPASALAVYRSYAEQEPRCLFAARRAGLLLYEAGEHQDALAMLEQALAIDPRDQDSLRARKNLAAEGALAATGLETAGSSRDLIKDHDAQRRQVRAARMQLTPEEIEDELVEVEAAVADNPDDVAGLKRLAELHELRRDPQSALDCLERAAALVPDDFDLGSRAGDLRLSLQEARVRAAEERGDLDAAQRARAALEQARVGEFRRRVAHHPTDLGLKYALGEALLALEDYDGAIAELQQAVKDPRKKAEALFLLGRAFRGKGLADLAKNQLHKAFDATGGIHGQIGKEIAYELGAVAEGQGETEVALEHYQRILEQDIGYRDVDEKIQRLRS